MTRIFLIIRWFAWFILACCFGMYLVAYVLATILQVEFPIYDLDRLSVPLLCLYVFAKEMSEE